MLDCSTEKGLCGDILLEPSTEPGWDIHQKQLSLSSNILKLCWMVRFSLLPEFTEVSQEQRTGNSKFDEPSSKLTCSLTPNSRNINHIQFVPKKWQLSHLCRYQSCHNVLQWHRWKVTYVGGRFLSLCDLILWESTEFREQILKTELSGTLVEN